MANPATADNVAARWRPLSDEEQTRAQTLLDDAWSLLTNKVTDVEARLDADPPTLDVNLVIMVLVEMVKRVMRNPDGLRQETIQDYSFTRDTNAAAGTLFIASDELDLLTPATSGAAFSIRAYGRPGWSRADECYCP